MPTYRIALAFFLLSCIRCAGEPMVVHEWGTFTCLQDEYGNAIGRINTDDEPVPNFVHELAAGMMFSPTQAYRESDSKGGGIIPAGDPGVTMRLETPVLYFHVPFGETAPQNFDVSVTFNGGLLTQYFPLAEPAIKDQPPGTIPVLGDHTVGSLTWRGISLGATTGTMPISKDPVWTAPRNVDSESVTVSDDREKFLFYRGLGHLDAPLKVIRTGSTLDIHQADLATKISQMWLVNAQADGTLAWRPLKKDTLTTAADFAPGDYSQKNLITLETSLHTALVGDGLYDDEADALLKTWENSYFKNPGQRLFFLVPSPWTDAVLPLKISTPAQVNRVMIGRIELITPVQRALLASISKALPLIHENEKADLISLHAAMAKLKDAAAKDPVKAVEYNALAGGHGNIADLGLVAVKVPQIYVNFLALGRFRTALLMTGETPTSQYRSLFQN